MINEIDSTFETYFIFSVALVSIGASKSTVDGNASTFKSANEYFNQMIRKGMIA